MQGGEVVKLVSSGFEERLFGPDKPPAYHAAPPIELAMSVCDACRARRARAVAILDRLPGLAHRIGSRSIGDERVDDALMVCAVLGVADGLDQASGRVVQLALKNLAFIAGGLRWSSWFIPTLRLGAPDPNVAVLTPWSHVSEEARQTLRDAYAKNLRSATLSLTATSVPPPVGWNNHEALPGCLLCGVDHVVVTDRDDRPWGDMYGAQPGTLRGKGSPDLLYGFCCRTCRKAMERHGAQALGLNALDAALGDYLGVEVPDPWSLPPGLDSQRLRVLSLLKAWCVTGKPPSTTPWAHLGNLETVRDVLHAF